MKLIDTSTINQVLKNNISLREDYFITPDIEQEMLVALTILKKSIPSHIKNITIDNRFDEASYIKNYFEMLNKYGGRSFFNMTGFGDISLIALAKTILEALEKINRQALPLPGFLEQVEIYVEDGGLRKRIKQEVGSQIKLYKASQI